MMRLVIGAAAMLAAGSWGQAPVAAPASGDAKSFAVYQLPESKQVKLANGLTVLLL